MDSVVGQKAPALACSSGFAAPGKGMERSEMVSLEKDFLGNWEEMKCWCQHRNQGLGEDGNV